MVTFIVSTAIASPPQALELSASGGIHSVPTLERVLPSVAGSMHYTRRLKGPLHLIASSSVAWTKVPYEISESPIVVDGFVVDELQTFRPAIGLRLVPMQAPVQPFVDVTVDLSVTRIRRVGGISGGPSYNVVPAIGSTVGAGLMLMRGRHLHLGVRAHGSMARGGTQHLDYATGTHTLALRPWRTASIGGGLIFGWHN